MSPWPEGVFLFFWGLLLGSFGLTTGQRLLAEKSVLPRSACEHCHKTLNPFELIPLFGWLALRGRCSRCSGPIPAAHPLCELAMGLLAVGLWWATGDAVQALRLSLLIGGLALISWLDLVTGQIYTFPVLVLGLGQAAYLGFSAPQEAPGALIGGLCGAGLFHWVSTLYLALRGKPGLGEGDASLLGLLGFYFGWEALLPLVFLSSVAGLLIGGLALLIRRQGLSTAIPFGPFLAIASLAYLFNPDLWQRLFHL